MRKHNKFRYRSGLEKEIAAFLKSCQKEVRYELLKIEWEDLRYRHYTPDFILDNGIIIESKGIFDSEDRRKHLCIKSQYPKLDIRFIFSNANAKLYKKAKSRYSDWCEKHGFLYAHRIIPQKWLTERKKRVQLGVLPYKKKRLKI
tara:strand:+ start:414 stop:848 length:435 start_codon:yes stop_codon:yes gene_type:complete